MTKALNITLLAFISLFLASCNKFSNGEVKTFPPRHVSEPFQLIEMCDNIDIKLKHSNSDTAAGTVIITTGENLYENITTEIEEVKKVVIHNGTIDTLTFNKLVIRNENTLNFLRPYSFPLTMTVYYDTLYQLIFNSNATITTDTLRGYDFWTDFSVSDSASHLHHDSLTANLHLYIYGGSGNYNVLTNCYRLSTLFQHGTSDLHLHGKAVRVETYGDYDSHGIIDGFHLEAGAYHQVTALGTNIIIARAVNQIIARNENIGHVYYVRYRKLGKTVHPGHMEGGHWIPSETVDTIFVCPLSVTKHGVYRDSITSMIDTCLHRY